MSVIGMLYFKDIKRYIESDLYRYYGNYELKTLIKAILINRSFKYSFWFRLCRSRNVFIRYFSIFMHRLYSTRYSIHISYQTKIGYGLYIGHGTSIVVSPTAIIGNNCNLSPFTIIGTNHSKAANVGDNVYIGPHVAIVDNVNIGNNVTIGAGSVVIKNIPEDMTSVGNPNRFFKSENIACYIRNRYVK